MKTLSRESAAQNRTNAKILKPFISDEQMETIMQLTHGEEGDFYAQKLAEYAHRVSTMPRVYEQDGKGPEAIVCLHYFMGNMDWYITEADTEEPLIGFGDTPQPVRQLAPIQYQAFGYADLGHGDGELGYIGIAELIENNVEIDLYWTPKTLREATAK